MTLNYTIFYTIRDIIYIFVTCFFLWYFLVIFTILVPFRILRIIIIKSGLRKKYTNQIRYLSLKYLRMDQRHKLALVLVYFLIIQTSRYLSGCPKHVQFFKWKFMTPVEYRTIWPLSSCKRTHILLTFDRVSIRILVGLITIHIYEEDEESVQHILCYCPALQERTLQCISRHSFRRLEYLNDDSIF